MRKPNPDSWQYLSRQLNQRIRVVRGLTWFIETYKIPFFLKDAAVIAKRCRRGPEFTVDDLPGYIECRHKEELSERLNLVLEYYKRERQKQIDKLARVDKMKADLKALKEQIPWMVKYFHPDAPGGDPVKFQQVQEAYRTLKS